METKNTILSQKDLEFLEAIVLKAGRIVTFDQIWTAIGNSVSREAARMRVAAMSKAGWLIRLKRGLYLAVTDISTLGFADVSDLVIAQAINTDAYISFESALQYHGMYDQMLNRIDAVTLRTTRTFKVLERVFTYSSIRHDLFFGYTDEMVNNCTVKIAEAEKALLDMLYFRTSDYGVRLVLEKMNEHREDLNFEKLKAYSMRYPLGMVRKIGFLLDRAGITTVDFYAQNQVKRNSFSKLTKDATQFNAKWRVYYDAKLDQ